jgi:hypothetical protein
LGVTIGGSESARIGATDVDIVLRTDGPGVESAHAPGRRAVSVNTPTADPTVLTVSIADILPPAGQRVDDGHDITRRGWQCHVERCRRACPYPVPARNLDVAATMLASTLVGLGAALGRMRKFLG